MPAKLAVFGASVRPKHWRMAHWLRRVFLLSDVAD